MQTTDLTPCRPGLEVCLHGPSPLEERGGQKRGLHSNCWGEVWCHVEHIGALFRDYIPLTSHYGGEELETGSSRSTSIDVCYE